MRKRAVTSLGVLTALLVIWQSLGNQTPTEHQAAQPVATLLPESENFDVERPKASEAIDETSVPQDRPPAESVTTTEYCAELSRTLEQQPSLSVGFAEGREVGERECGMMLQMIGGSTVPALPGLGGFEVKDFGDFVALNPRGRLFEEADNPEWSRSMESQIYNEIASLIDFPVITLHSVCRTSTCGLLFAFPSTAQSGHNYNYYAQELADALGFSGFHGGVSMPRSGVWFTYIYLGDWETTRPEPEAPVRAIPQSFEEALEQASESNDSE